MAGRRSGDQRNNWPIRFELRQPATPADIAAASDLYLVARKSAVPAVPPLVHGDDDVRLWFANVVIVERQVWLAEAEGQLVGVMVLDEDELDQLYVHPSWQGHGVGAGFVEFAKHERPDGLSLWTFESNRGASASSQVFMDSRGMSRPELRPRRWSER